MKHALKNTSIEQSVLLFAENNPMALKFIQEVQFLVRATLADEEDNMELIERATMFQAHVFSIMQSYKEIRGKLIEWYMVNVSDYEPHILSRFIVSQTPENIIKWYKDGNINEPKNRLQASENELSNK